MGGKTALIILVVIAAFALTTATLVTPLPYQAYATKTQNKQCTHSVTFQTGQEVGDCASGRVPLPSPP